MSITINLPADVEAKIRAAAQKSGESVEGFAQRLLVREATEDTPEELAVILAGAPNTRWVNGALVYAPNATPPAWLADLQPHLSATDGANGLHRFWGTIDLPLPDEELRDALKEDA